MLKKIITLFLIPAFLLQVIGCYSVNYISKNEITDHNGIIQSVILKDNSEIRFDKNGGKYFTDQGNIEGVNDMGTYINLPLTNIRALYEN